MATPGIRRPAGLGLMAATALVVGNMVGSGDYLLPASLAKYGGISILGWVVTAVGAVLLALVFAQLGRAYPQTGGPYAFSRRAFGDFIGFQTAWGYWIATWTSNAALAIGFVSSSTTSGPDWPTTGCSPPSSRSPRSGCSPASTRSAYARARPSRSSPRSSS